MSLDVFYLIGILWYTPLFFLQVKHDFAHQGDDQLTFNYRILGTWAFAPHPSRWCEFQDWYAIKSADKTFHPYVEESPVHTGTC